MRKTILLPVVLVCLSFSVNWAEAAGASAPGMQPGAAVHRPVSTATVAGTLQPKGDDVAKQKEGPGAAPQTADPSGKEPKWLCWLVALVPAGVFLVFLVLLKKALQRSNWSLQDALSESEPTKAPDGTMLRDKDGNVMFGRSSSRFMAFIGFFAIIVWIVGLSVPTLYQFVCTGRLPALDGVSTFLLAQAGIFAPYIANKLASAVKS